MKKLAGILGLIFFGLALGLVVSEIAIRILHLHSDEFTEPHPLFGWMFIPSKEGYFVNVVLYLNNDVKNGSDSSLSTRHNVAQLRPNT